MSRYARCVAFINELMALRGNSIDVTTADRLIAYAEDLSQRGA